MVMFSRSSCLPPPSKSMHFLPCVAVQSNAFPVVPCTTAAQFFPGVFTFSRSTRLFENVSTRSWPWWTLLISKNKQQTTKQNIARTSTNSACVFTVLFECFAVYIETWQCELLQVGSKDCEVHFIEKINIIRHLICISNRNILNLSSKIICSTSN